MTQLWMVRAQGGELLPTFLENKIVSIGWCSDVDFTGFKKEDFRKALKREYPSSLKSIPAWVGFCENFVNKMQINDYVLTYDSAQRVYHLGIITSNYKYDSKLQDSHTRAVNWFDKTISRDLISNSTKNSLGSPQTIFKLSTEQKDELLHLLNRKETFIKDDTIIENNKEFSETLFDNAKESLKDSINSLNPDEMEELIKEVLNAMGYVAKRSKKGSDRGIDVFASTDGLGLEEPRIFVEVKHRSGQIGAPAIRQFLGGRKQGDKCLYISTGGFSKEALYEAERANIALTLVDINLLAETITRCYDKFSVDGKMLLPLKKIYIPA